MIENFSPIDYLNRKRANYFQNYNIENYPTDKKIEDWMSHKIFAIISFPANLLTIGIGSIGVLTGICTIGAFKVAVFAITLGNIKLPIPTGVVWFGEKVIISTLEVFSTIFEVGSDIYYFCKRCIKTVQEILTILGLKALYLKIHETVIEIFEFIGNRLEKGFYKASESEKNFQLGEKSLPIITHLHLFREKFVTKSSEYDQRSFKDIIVHSFLSVLSLPINAIAFTSSVAASVILSIIYCSKAILYAATNIHLPIPTFVQFSIATMARTGSYLFQNTTVCVIDIPITLYKISKATGLYQVAVKVTEIVSYIPQAIFERF